MFSLVTKEVRLVTKNAQRPYKYASLENIICIAPNCAAAPAASAADIVEQAQRSETDELLVALHASSVAALETYLEKYPETPKRSEIQSSIENLSRAEFSEWSLFAVDNKNLPWYIQLSSIRLFGDRVAVSLRYKLDPDASKNYFGKTLSDAAYRQDISVYDCKQRATVLSEESVLNDSMSTVFHYSFGDPRYLDFSTAKLRRQQSAMRYG